MPISKVQQKTLSRLNYDLFSHPSLNPPAPATLYTRIAAEASPAVSRGIFETRAATRVPLPPISELYRLYEEYNLFYFGGRLPFVRIEYSERMTSAGSYSPSDRLIRIGRKYHELFPQEITDTLKHEMIHLIHPTHGAAFRTEADRLGASVRAKAHPSLMKPPRYVYACPVCGKEYPRQKRLRMASCGSCSKGGFDMRYKLAIRKKSQRLELPGQRPTMQAGDLDTSEN